MVLGLLYWQGVNQGYKLDQSLSLSLRLFKSVFDNTLLEHGGLPFCCKPWNCSCWMSRGNHFHAFRPWVFCQKASFMLNKHFKGSCELLGLKFWIWFETDLKQWRNVQGQTDHYTRLKNVQGHTYIQLYKPRNVHGLNITNQLNA